MAFGVKDEHLELGGSELKSIPLTHTTPGPVVYSLPLIHSFHYVALS